MAIQKQSAFKFVIKLVLVTSILFRSFSPPRAFASSREANTFGLYTEMGQCYGYYASANFGVHLGNYFRLGLGYEYYFEKTSNFKPTKFSSGSTPVAELKWLMTDNDFTGFLGLVSTVLVQVGVDYVSSSGLNFGLGVQTGSCTGAFLHIGKYF